MRWIRYTLSFFDFSLLLDLLELSQQLLIVIIVVVVGGVGVFVGTLELMLALLLLI